MKYRATAFVPGEQKASEVGRGNDIGLTVQQLVDRVAAVRREPLHRDGAEAPGVGLLFDEVIVRRDDQRQRGEIGRHHHAQARDVGQDGSRREAEQQRA